MVRLKILNYLYNTSQTMVKYQDLLVLLFPRINLFWECSRLKATLSPAQFVVWIQLVKLDLTTYCFITFWETRALWKMWSSLFTVVRKHFCSWRHSKHAATSLNMLYKRKRAWTFSWVEVFPRCNAMFLNCKILAKSS